jgi:hypothetical protein
MEARPAGVGPGGGRLDPIVEKIRGARQNPISKSDVGGHGGGPGGLKGDGRPPPGGADQIRQRSGVLETVRKRSKNGVFLSVLRPGKHAPLPNSVATFNVGGVVEGFKEGLTPVDPLVGLSVPENEVPAFDDLSNFRRFGPNGGARKNDPREKPSHPTAGHF